MVDKHWPGYADLIEKYGIEFPESPLICDLDKTKTVLGYQPQYNFGTFLAELRARDEAGEPVR